MKLLTLDLETTGPDPELHGIHQIAGEVYIQGEGLKETFDYYVKPFSSDNVQQKALDIAGVTYEKIMGYADPNEIYAEITKTFKDYVDPFDPTDKFFVVGYGVSFFDMKMLYKFANKCKDPYFGSYVHRHSIDVYHHAVRWAAPVLHQMPNMKQETIYQMVFGEPLDGAHNAVHDYRASKRLAQFFMPELYV